MTIRLDRGKNLPDISDDSAWNKRMPPTCKNGKIAIAITIIPIPPSHCSMPRHNNTDFGNSSKPTITVAPVVVMADMASNQASVNPKYGCAKTNGRVANRLAQTQHKVVSKNTCRARNFASPVFCENSTSPVIMPITASVR